MGFAAEALKEVNGFSEDEEIAYPADQDACWRIASAGWDFVFVDGPVEYQGVGQHQATNKFCLSGESTRCIANVFRRMSKCASWRETIDFLRTDITEWPLEQQGFLLFELAVAGLKDDYRAFWRICRNERLSRTPVARNARLANLVGPAAFLKAVLWSKSARNGLRRFAQRP
jgi:GT2 family glycosyltransferase